MRKFIIVILFILLGKIPGLKAQCLPDVNKLKFTGAAPAPWAIDGLVNDWQTILGPFTGNNDNPYTPPGLSRFNWASDNPGFDDFDNPEPASDIKFSSFIHDDYNVYFYFRRLASSNIPNAFYYFCDVNADGYMNAGEPVFGAHFNAQNVSELIVYRFVPDTNEDYIPGKGNQMTSGFVVDGYTMKGSLEKVFGGPAIPSNYALITHEVFKAAVTENGYGIELAIPWRFFRNWNTLSVPLTPEYIFSYHLALQKNPVSYRPEQVQDNVGNCCGRLSVSGNAAFDVADKNISRNADGSFRLNVTLKNQTNVSEGFFLASVSFKNIQLDEGLSFNPSDLSVTVNGVPYDNFGTSLTFVPPDLIPEETLVGPFGTADYIVDIHLPANNSVLSASVELDIFSRFESFLRGIYCYENTGGGKAINPVGFDINTEEPANNSKKNNNAGNDRDRSIDLRVYPNPNSGTATVILPTATGIFRIDLEDISGRIIQRWSGVRTGNFQLQNLKPGFYLLKVISGETGKQMTKKIIVQ